MKKYFFIILLIFNVLVIKKELPAQDESTNYQTLITMGDNEFNKEEYIKAKSYYQEALRLKKDDQTAKKKLDRTLQKIREQSEKQEIFYQYIDEADSHYANDDYEKSLTFYNKAKNLFPRDEYVNEQIQHITQIINEEKEKIASFNEIIKLADELMSHEKYTEAVLQYKSALELYPNNSNAKQKHNDAKSKKEEYENKSSNFERLKQEAKEFTLRKKYAEAIEKYQAALEIFPKDSEVKELISTLSEQKKISDKYNSQINRADSLYLEKSYEKAKSAYNKALAVMPDDSYSSDMIKRIDETLNSSEYLSLKNYLNLIEEAKALESNKEIDAALSKYQSALRSNPGDEFAIQKIEYLTNTINNRNKEIELDTQYHNLISQGDNNITKEDYYAALDCYTRAYELIPNKNEAKEKKENTQIIINEIETQLALEKQKWEEYYNIAMASAQNFMQEENYTEAMNEYNKALKYKENDSSATRGLNTAKQLHEAKFAKVAAEYNQIISNADMQFENKNYDKALELYNKALDLNTGITYPSEMISKINTTLQENRLVQLIDNKIQITSNETKRFTFNPIDPSVRKSNYILLKAKNLSEKAYTMYISYGCSDGNNGSLILRIPNNKDVNDYIIRIGAQYKWFSEDNTWIELTPENGDIEIELMEITKGS